MQQALTGQRAVCLLLGQPFRKHFWYTGLYTKALHPGAAGRDHFLKSTTPTESSAAVLMCMVAATDKLSATLEKIGRQARECLPRTCRLLTDSSAELQR